MAEFNRNQNFGAGPTQDGDKTISPQKRKAAGDLDDPYVSKKLITPADDSTVGKKPISIGIKKKPGISINLGGGLTKPTISMNLGAKNPAPIKMALSSTVKESPTVKPKDPKVASAFNEESDSEEEEMPFEAKMRMKNVGRETPTAAGPNSFGKGNMGFCDRTKMIERDLQKQMQELGEKADDKYS